jgi:hypothetical protein
MIVDAGRKQIAKLITGLQDNNESTPVAFKYVRVGDGGDNTSMSQTTLDSQISTHKVVTPIPVGNTLVYEIEFLGSELTSNVVSELGIFDAAEGGNMLCRVNFDPIGPLSADETLTFSFRVEIE